MIEIENITKEFKTKYSRVLGVRDVSLTVKEGEFFGLVGRSGSGKTTLGKIVMGLCPPDEGKVIINGRDMTKCLVEQRLKVVRISMVFQHPDATLNPGMTVRRNIQEIRRCITVSDLEWYFDEVNLPREKINLYPYQLSGGEKRRVALIQALVVKPKILIADELFSGVDGIVRNTIANLLKKMQQEGLTLILISHDMEIVDYLCHRKVTMENGRLIYGGKA